MKGKTTEPLVAHFDSKHRLSQAGTAATEAYGMNYMERKKWLNGCISYAAHKMLFE